MSEVDVDVLFIGYGQAHYRFLHEDIEVERIGKSTVDPQAARAFLPLFEALNWAVALCDRLDAVWPRPLAPKTYWHDGFPQGQTMRGVRFARNRVHHQWAAALRRGQFRQTAEVYREFRSGEPRPPFRIVAPRDPLLDGGSVWVWRRQLPPGRPDAEGERAYMLDLADYPVRRTLDELLELFDAARSRL